MEYIEHGSLADYLKKSGPCSTNNAQSITRQLLEGLAILHKLDIIHKNINPQVRNPPPPNITCPLTNRQSVLIASPEPIWVKITDFQATNNTEDSTDYPRSSNTVYTAPETLGLLPRRYRGVGFARAVDLWALGCVVHEILTGEFPFREIEDEQDRMSGLEFGLEADIEAEVDITSLYSFCQNETDLPTDRLRRSLVSEVAIEFVTKLLVANPKSRATATEALASAWLVYEEETSTGK